MSAGNVSCRITCIYTSGCLLAPLIRLGTGVPCVVNQQNLVTPQLCFWITTILTLNVFSACQSKAGRNDRIIPCFRIYYYHRSAKKLELTQTHSRNIYCSEGSLGLSLTKIFLNRTHSDSGSPNCFWTELTWTQTHRHITQPDSLMAWPECVSWLTSPY